MRVEVERDHGQWWERPSTGLKGNGPFVLDLTEEVKGRHAWRVRVHLLLANMQLRDLEFTTVTQVSPSVYPRLTPEGCEVDYRTGSRAVRSAIPDFSLPGADTSRFEEVRLRSPNVVYELRSEDNRVVVYRTTDNKPGHVAFKLDAPDRLSEIRAAIRYQLRVPPPENADYHLDISTDDGTTWKTFATADIPPDNEHSSGWLAGAVDVSDAEVSEALVRVHLYAGGHQTGLIDARFYGVYRTPESGPLEITWGWQEDDRSREHTETIAAGTSEATFQIPTGRNVRDKFVRMSAR